MGDRDQSKLLESCLGRILCCREVNKENWGKLASISRQESVKLVGEVKIQKRVGAQRFKDFGKESPPPLLWLKASRGFWFCDEGVCHVYLCAWVECVSGPFICTIEIFSWDLPFLGPWLQGSHVGGVDAGFGAYRLVYMSGFHERKCFWSHLGWVCQFPFIRERRSEKEGVVSEERVFFSFIWSDLTLYITDSILG